MAEPEQTTHLRPTRRDLLRTGAVGVGIAGAAWVTPSVLSFDAVSAASCNCNTASGVNWASTGANRPASTNGPANISGYPFNWGSFGGVSVTFILTGATSSLVFPGSASLTGRQPTTQNGAVTGIYGIDRQGAAAGTDVTLSIRFGCNVRNLTFRVLDIDRAISGGNNYVDRVTLRPFLAGAAISGTFTPVSATPSFTPTGPITGTSAMYTGNATTSSNQSTGNVTVSVPGPVDRFDIVYNAAHTGTGTLQEVALNNLAWSC